MPVNKSKDLGNGREIKDEQERIFFRLNTIKDKEILNKKKLVRRIRNDQKFKKIISEYEILKNILLFVIFLGILIFFIFMIIKINYLIILIDVIIVSIYYVYFKYLKYKYISNLNISKQEFIFIRNNQKNRSNRNFCLFLNILILVSSIYILFITLFETESLIFILTLITLLVYLYISD